MFPVDLEPGLIVLERPIPGCTLGSEFADLPPFYGNAVSILYVCALSGLMKVFRLREGTKVTPEGVVWSTRPSGTGSPLSA